jgi:hypothetical protein
MDHSDFYVAAATVIPLLLIAVMATRNLRPGELERQPTITTLVFGLPVIGELAAFSFLFFQPVPATAAAILAMATWAGLLSQLAIALWWLATLIVPGFPAAHAVDVATYFATEKTSRVQAQLKHLERLIEDHVATRSKPSHLGEGEGHMPPKAQGRDAQLGSESSAHVGDDPAP